ncbi:MAG: hypothetical protein H6R18_2024, partial [Proteobacteria bacterium]|nr:hypothetical protein [Pseudomonadota bacterium]
IETPFPVFGKYSQKSVLISAFDCKDMTMATLAFVRYDSKGQVIAGDFFMGKSTLRVEKNKQRFIDACTSFAQ